MGGWVGLGFSEPLEGLCDVYWTTGFFGMTRVVYDGRKKQKAALFTFVYLFTGVFVNSFNRRYVQNTEWKKLLNFISWRILICLTCY